MTVAATSTLFSRCFPFSSGCWATLRRTWSFGARFFATYFSLLPSCCYTSSRWRLVTTIHFPGGRPFIYLRFPPFTFFGYFCLIVCLSFCCCQVFLRRMRTLG